MNSTHSRPPAVGQPPQAPSGGSQAPAVNPPKTTPATPDATGHRRPEDVPADKVDVEATRGHA